MYESFVPGKVILVGEHAVVYGKMALAASIGLGVRVGVTERKGGGEPNKYINDDKGLIKKAVELAGGDENFNIKIVSELPIGSGLGSSAAISAAVIKGVSGYLGNSLTNDELFKLTLECEKIAHGNPSGVDPATVVYGGLIAYIKGQSFERLEIKAPIKLLLIDTLRPTESTRTMVELVASNPNKDKIIEKIGKLTLEVRERLVANEDVAQLLNENGILLEKLGVVGEKARMLSKKLRDLDCSVKITGAGGVKTGSGMMIAMNDDLTKIKKLLDNEQIKYFETIIGVK